MGSTARAAIWYLQAAARAGRADDLRAGLRRAGRHLLLERVDEGRGIAALELLGRAPVLLLRALGDVGVGQAAGAADGVDGLDLPVGGRVVAEDAPLTAAGDAADAAQIHRRVDDAALLGGAEVEVAAELGAEAERGQRAAERLGFGLLDVVAEVLDVLAAPAGGRTAAGNGHARLEDGHRAIVFDQFGINDGVGVLGAQPEEAPLDFEVVGAADRREILAGLERAGLAAHGSI